MQASNKGFHCRRSTTGITSWNKFQILLLLKQNERRSLAEPTSRSELNNQNPRGWQKTWRLGFNNHLHTLFKAGVPNGPKMSLHAALGGETTSTPGQRFTCSFIIIRFCFLAKWIGPTFNQTEKIILCEDTTKPLKVFSLLSAGLFAGTIYTNTWPSKEKIKQVAKFRGGEIAGLRHSYPVKSVHEEYKLKVLCMPSAQGTMTQPNPGALASSESRKRCSGSS